MAKFKIHFSVPNTDKRTQAMSAYKQPTHTVVEAFNAASAQDLVRMQYPGARLHGIQTL